ncbi:NAD(P)/FAD-dependent oxidoreductase [Streptomyces flaveolus]|uniref:NAD(P)/FAD-dependent oxidoreductase n=1 Tax=Streptomyces flaveolus TaxID=67297 RepID=UPI0037941E8C
MDHLLAEAAVRKGVEFRPGTNVVDLEWRDGRVTGVRLGTRQRSTSERAHLVIGADGRNSTVARLVQAPFLRQDPRMSRTYYSYWSGNPDQGLRIYGRRGTGTACIPTQGGVTLIAVAFSQALPPHVGGDRGRAYKRMV